jgi:hypothetical protein
MAGGAKRAMKRVQKAAAAGRSMAKKAPAKAKRMMKTVKQKATTMGEAASSVAEKVTQVAATAAGVVVGTVQAVMPDSSDRESTDNTGGAA